MLLLSPFFHLTSCTPIKSNLYFDNFLAAAVSELVLYKLLKFQVRNLMPLFRCLGHTKISVQVRGFLYKRFVNRIRFNGEELLAPRPSPNWRTTPCRSSATAYSIYSQLPSILEAVPSPGTRGRAMLWWQGPTYHGTAYYISILEY
jgi:hypothetical protein